MKPTEERRMRLTLNGKEVERMAQLRAYYSEKSNRPVMAHEVMSRALSKLYEEVFVKNGETIPEEWPAYLR